MCKDVTLINLDQTYFVMPADDNKITIFINMNAFIGQRNKVLATVHKVKILSSLL